jgi:hypothetical protein
MSQPDKDLSSTVDKKAEGEPSGISGAIRPLVKEVVKVGLVAYETVAETASGIGKQLNELVEEARSEAEKPPSSDSAQAEDEKKGAGSKGGKVKHAHGKSS